MNTATPAREVPAAPTSAPPGSATTLGFRLWKLCAWAGPVYIAGALLFFAGIAGFLPPPREHWTAAEVARFFTDNEVRIRIGTEGVLVVAFFYVPWSLAVARVMERVEGTPRLLSRVQLYGGLSTALVTMSCAVVWLTASFRAGTRSPEDIQLLNDLAFMIFALTIMVTVFQIVAFGVAWLLDVREQLVPRWVGYFSLWCALLFVPVFLVPSLQHGAFAWHGLINFYIGLGAFFGWITVTSWATLRAISRLQRDASA